MRPKVPTDADGALLRPGDPVVATDLAATDTVGRHGKVVGLPRANLVEVRVDDGTVIRSAASLWRLARALGGSP